MTPRIILFALGVAMAASASAQGQPATPRGSGNLPAPATQASANNTVFVSWQDPRENAFTVGIPKGWSVTGGTIRVAALDVRFAVRAQSPDGGIRLFLGDTDLGPRMIPNPTYARLGAQEGQWIPGAPGGGKVLVARFVTGAQFAQQYAAARLCRGARITGAGDLPNLTAEINAKIAPLAARYQIVARASAGEAYFACGSAVGYAMVDTLWVGPQSGGAPPSWLVERLSAVITSDPNQASYAAYVLHSAVETFAMNPAWEAQNQRNVDEVSRSAAEAQRAYGAHQASSASAGGFNHPNNVKLPTDLRKKWAGEDKVNQRASDARLGTKWMHGDDGTNVRVENSSTNWYKDRNGNTIPGPESGSLPSQCAGGGCTKLTPGWQ